MRSEFVSLIKQFVQEELSGEEFKNRYLELRRQALDESDLDPILRADMLSLKERRLNGEISGEEFSNQFEQLVAELWHDRDIQPLSREGQVLFEELFYAVEALNAPVHPIYGGESINEDQLHVIANNALEQLISPQ